MLLITARSGIGSGAAVLLCVRFCRLESVTIFLPPSKPSYLLANQKEDFCGDFADQIRELLYLDEKFLQSLTCFSKLPTSLGIYGYAITPLRQNESTSINSFFVAKKSG